MSFGLILNAIICFAIVLATFAFAVTLHQNKNRQKGESIPTLNALIIFWSLVGMFFLFAGLRTLAAYGNFIEVETALYYFGSIPFAFITVPLVYFIIYIILGDHRVSIGVSTVFLIFGSIYLIALFGFGIIGPFTEEWGSTFEINSDLAINVYLSGLFIIPTSMILGLMLLILLQRVPKRVQNRIAFSLVAISLIFDFMLLDNIAPSGATQMAARIFIFIGVVLGYFSYFSESFDKKLEMMDNRLGVSQTELEDFENEDQ
ncbi:MAG: hypothetical protein Q7J35_19070 [Candidatus Methanoperedens sp.]|nr:hypothetical protein [Candidatus Methanoperedens sp.]